MKLDLRAHSFKKVISLFIVFVLTLSSALPVMSSQHFLAPPGGIYDGFPLKKKPEAPAEIKKPPEAKLSLLEKAAIDEQILHMVSSPGEIPGQDENVVARAKKLLFTEEQIAAFNEKGIFIFDIDKTLAKRDLSLLKETRGVIEQLLREGHLVVIATGQAIKIQRDRIVKPIDSSLRHNLVVITNEGTVPHHFLSDGREYVVQNEHTQLLSFTQEQGDIMHEIVDDFMQENGFEYAPGGEYEEREMAQAAFKINATLQTREGYAEQLAEKLRARGVTGFRGWASGSTTISFLHENANKNRAGIGFLKGQGFLVKNAVYHGDEFFPGGNDACIIYDPESPDKPDTNLADPDINVAIVGRYHAGYISKSDKAIYIGGGPYATTKFVRDFLNNKRQLGAQADFQSVLQYTKVQNINLETITSNLIDLSVKERLRKLSNEWLPENHPLREFIAPYIEKKVDPKKPILERLAVEELQELVKICREYRVGPLFLQSLYQQMCGATLQEDFNKLSEMITGNLYGPSVDQTDPQFFALRNTLEPFSELMVVVLGQDTAGTFDLGVEKLTGQNQAFRYNPSELKGVEKTMSRQIVRIQKALDIFFEEAGVCGWLLAGFGNDLTSFHATCSVEDLGKPIPDVGDEISENKLKELTKGLVGLSGGGGSRLMAAVMLEAKIQHLVLPVSAEMPFIMIVPSEDDGGSSAIMLHIGEHVFRFKLPAMGDSMNAFAGLSAGAEDEYGDPAFPQFFNVARERFPLDGNDPLPIEFSQLAFEQIQSLIHSRTQTSKEDWQKALIFFRSLYSVIKEFDLVALEGQSMGNIMWFAVADKVAGIGENKESTSKKLKRLTKKQIVSIQRYFARIFDLKKMLVMPSNLYPGILYALSENLVVRSYDPMSLHLLEPLDKPTEFEVINRKFTVTEDIGKVVDSNKGYTYVDYDVKEGEEITVSHSNKEIPLDGSAMFRAHITRDDKGKLYIKCNIGAEQWGAKTILKKTPQVVGISDKKSRELAPSQLKWGARVCSVNNGKTLRVYLDRVGAGTTLRFNDDSHITVKGRVVVKQTNITESFHESKLYKAGFVGTKKPEPNEFLIDALDNTEVGCVIGPGSTITSLLAILLIDEYREKLRIMAEKGLPVIFLLNPYKDNETAYLSITGIMKLIEDTVGEPVFGLERGGFVTDMFVNDARQMSEHMRELTTFDYFADTQLRAAEKPRGIFWFDEESNERQKIQDMCGKDFSIYTENILKVIYKEVRGGAPLEGVGFDPVQTGQILENIILNRMRQKAKESELYTRVLEIFHGNENALNEAITYVRHNEETWSEVEALQRIERLYTTKAPLTQDILTKVAPDLIVVNFAHSIKGLQDDEKLPDQIRAAITEFVKAGGKIIILTGIPFNDVSQYLFVDGDNPIPVKYRNNIFTLALSGNQVRQGTKSIIPDAPKIDEKAFNIVRDVLNSYGLAGKRGVINDYDSLISLHLHEFTSLTREQVAAINSGIKDFPGLSDQERAAFEIQWMPGLIDRYDLRDIIVKQIKRRFKSDQISLNVESKGAGSIDICKLKEAESISNLLADFGSGLHSTEVKNILVAAAGKGLRRISEQFPEALFLAIPAKDSQVLFNPQSVINGLDGKNNQPWNIRSAIGLFTTAAKALNKGTSAGPITVRSDADVSQSH